MNLLIHKIANWFLKRRMDQVERFMRFPHETQEQLLLQLLEKARNTCWGKTYGYADIRNAESFRKWVPLSTYEQLFPFIDRAFRGEADVLWPGKMNWFAKSSGTTNDKSKYIPVSPEALEGCHFKAGQDMLTMYLQNKPESKLFTGKALSIGGSHYPNPHNPNIRVGDVSAVITENLPVFYEMMRTPSKEVALMSNWDEKIEAMANEVMQEDVTSIAGVPTWTRVLIDRIFDKLGITDRNLLQVWPNLELFVHGGVSFEPYRQQFRQLIPTDNMTYLDCYNASEGFFAVQNELQGNDMLLMLDYGIYFEFLPMEHFEEENPPVLGLHEVETGVNYALVISTNAGLWRYLIGDTIMFTSTSPYKIRVTGRTKYFINAFGEELIMDNAEQALQAACQATGAVIADYTAAPIYFGEDQGKGGHEWLIEFRQAPNDLERFTQVLDDTLKQLNSDYEAKRSFDLALLAPLVRVLPPGTFMSWMRKRGKLGGQNKVPRLANHRRYVDEILAMLAVDSA
ncbi:MAG: hypothetical protein D6730_12170 [Bacteroidetes bacterium]|nr:MAG: hypothetical protein D6730_12170 [Bacteroidota bacterium]